MQVNVAEYKYKPLLKILIFDTVNTREVVKRGWPLFDYEIKSYRKVNQMIRIVNWNSSASNIKGRPTFRNHQHERNLLKHQLPMKKRCPHLKLSASNIKGGSTTWNNQLERVAHLLKISAGNVKGRPTSGKLMNLIWFEWFDFFMTLL